jgi:hypothetical protein
MAINGQWTVHYAWDCRGEYIQRGITFNDNGTFSTTSFTGKWTQIEGMILFQFDNYKTTYGGNFVGNAMVGMMSTFGGAKGCWYAIKVGTTTMMAEEDEAEFDESGSKAKQSNK